MSPWLLLAIAIAFEVAGTVAVRESDGFTRPLPIAVIAVGYGVAFYLMALVTRHLSISTVYAVWSGGGIALLTAIGFVAFDERISPLKLASLLLIGLGIVGLNLAGAHR
jgi:small multidrug resistance pump